jgi:hypothetical protein
VFEKLWGFHSPPTIEDISNVSIEDSEVSRMASFCKKSTWLVVCKLVACEPCELILGYIQILRSWCKEAVSGFSLIFFHANINNESHNSHIFSSCEY